ncbi:MAG: sulfotransferase [Pseudomonadota bacterium]
MGAAKLPLVFIAGAGHSGSTLLERLVSGARGHLGLGEVYQLIDQRNPIRHSLGLHRCSCGVAIDACRFWTAAIAALSQVEHASEAARYAALADHLIDAAPRGSVLIDSSKSPRALMHLVASGRFEIKVLHLVRDIRAWLIAQKRADRRNDIATLPQNIRRYGTFKGARRYALRSSLARAWHWKVTQQTVRRVIARHSLPHLPVSYERLCFAPDRVAGEIGAFLGTTIPPYAAGAVCDDSHSIFGNRMRFDPAKLSQITYDYGWLADDAWLWTYALTPGLRRLNRSLLETGDQA